MDFIFSLGWVGINEDSPSFVCRWSLAPMQLIEDEEAGCSRFFSVVYSGADAGTSEDRGTSSSSRGGGGCSEGGKPQSCQPQEGAW